MSKRKYHNAWLRPRREKKTAIVFIRCNESKNLNKLTSASIIKNNSDIEAATRIQNVCGMLTSKMMTEIFCL